MPMQPSPIAETSKPPFPSLRFCIFPLHSRLDSRTVEAVSRSFRFIAYFSRGLEELLMAARPRSYPVNRAATLQSRDFTEPRPSGSGFDRIGKRNMTKASEYRAELARKI